MATAFDADKIAEGEALAEIVRLLDHLDATEIDELQRLHLPAARNMAVLDEHRVRRVLVPVRAKL